MLRLLKPRVYRGGDKSQFSFCYESGGHHKIYRTINGNTTVQIGFDEAVLGNLIIQGTLINLLGIPLTLKEYQELVSSPPVAVPTLSERQISLETRINDDLTINCFGYYEDYAIRLKGEVIIHGDDLDTTIYCKYPDNREFGIIIDNRKVNVEARSDFDWFDGVENGYLTQNTKFLINNDAITISLNITLSKIVTEENLISRLKQLTFSDQSSDEG